MCVRVGVQPAFMRPLRLSLSCPSTALPASAQLLLLPTAPPSCRHPIPHLSLPAVPHPQASAQQLTRLLDPLTRIEAPQRDEAECEWRAPAYPAAAAAAAAAVVVVKGSWARSSNSAVVTCAWDGGAMACDMIGAA